MEDQQLKNYQQLFCYLNSIFVATGYRLTDKKPKHILSGLIANLSLWVMTFFTLLIGYLAIFEESERYIVAQQAAAICGALDFIASVMNRQMHWEEVQNLIDWFDSLYSQKYPEEYQEIFYNMKERINKYFKWIFW